ncbi:hypothetical protein C8R44DRAFT_599989 [Mycena epipterygia]|nr:hypothetical protein C8R44DRAFT_599989 [Mycena epipterygia]
MPAHRTHRSPRVGGSPISVRSDAVTTSSSSENVRRSSRTQSDSRDASTPESDLTSLSPSPEPDPPVIILRGQKLQPTVVFDILWRWLAERKAIYDRRRAGMPAPWTSDKILSKYKFCNAYRVLDRTSQFTITDVIEKGSQDRTELLFRILLFNCFNRIETWKFLEERFNGALTYADFDLDKYNKVLSKADMTLYTGAYQKIAYTYEYKANHMGYLQQLQIFMQDLPDVLANAKYAADVYEAIAAYPGMGAFTTFQLMLILSYSPLLNFSGNDFVIPGPGGRAGLLQMFGSSLRRAKKAAPGIEADILRWMAKTQRAHFKRLGLDFAYLRDAEGKELALDLADLEHAVCEVDKYVRRGQLRKFCASPAGLHATPSLPKAWAHPARRVVRVRAGPLIVEQRYCVEKIVAERRGEHGVEYLIKWFGYSNSERTWEPSSHILEDAPAAVEEYLRGKASGKEGGPPLIKSRKKGKSRR